MTMVVSGDVPSSRTRWLDAVSVLAVLVAVLLAARQLRPLVEVGAFVARTGDTVVFVPASAWPRAGAWVAIGVAVLCRWRTAAALGAWAAVLFELAVAVPRLSGDPGAAGPLDLLVWPSVLAVVAAVLLSVSAAVSRGAGLPGLGRSGPDLLGRSGPDLLGRRGYWLLAAAAAVTALSAAAIPFLGEYFEPSVDAADQGWSVSFAVPSNLARTVAGVTFGAVLVLALAAASGAERAVRSRACTLVAAGAAGFAAIQLGFPRPFNVSDLPLLSPTTQAAVLVVAPGLVLGAGLLLVRSARSPRA